jgi:predicted enzyme related to lactoylglutathione lyase
MWNELTNSLLHIQFPFILMNSTPLHHGRDGVQSGCSTFTMHRHMRSERRMVMQSAVFAWYELLTTDVSAAQSFYGKVLGWDVQDASTPELAYRLFNMGGSPVAGLMELPLDGRKKGATPRWVGYVAVEDVDAVVDQLKRLGGTVYVPPTESNIGRLAVVADPQTATLALVKGLKYGDRGLGGLGRVCWHELLAADAKAAFEFYGRLLGWQKVQAATGLIESYQLFAAGEQTMGGMFNKIANAPVPFWLYYFEVADLDLATRRVRAEGGHITRGPIELWGDTSIAHCIDPQGAVFALQGARTKTSQADDPQSARQIGWSAKWGGISSHGRLLGTKPKDKSGR